MSYEPLQSAVSKQSSGTPPSSKAGFFGADPDPIESAVTLIPVPWEGTVSYGGGTSRGPEAIRLASHQLDLMDPFFDRPYQAGISSVPLGIPLTENMSSATIEEMNAMGAKINGQLKVVAGPLVEKNKIVGVIGGEHSVPLGLMQALAEKESYGILQVDAHHDLREAYEGYQYSHASIMYNALHGAKNITRLVSVGIRDFSEDEAQLAKDGRISTYYWGAINRQLSSGRSWHDVVKKILRDLPDRVYVSFDIDGLSPECCPNTGTPVPGGLSFDQASYLLEELGRSQKKIVGFDLCEVAPKAQSDDEWDANVGARILYKLCGAALASQGRCAILGE